ncbi:MAG: hypothetical protein LBO74_02260 [Candidatus Symbiothrix sp.]|jgi:hypothetical protein|nr:hypothetical protein [Candidatus Symbiothrix sp.]
MTTMELNARKASLVKEILNETDENLLEGLITYISKVKKRTTTPPCQFSVEELRAIVMQSEKDFENGDYVTLEKIKAKHPRL